MNVGLLVSSSQIDRVWDLAAPYLSRVDDYHWSLDDMYHQAVEGYISLWLCLKDSDVVGVCLTTIQESPRCRSLNVLTMAGDAGDWDEMMGDVERHALQNNCTHIEIWGRRGWLRVLTGYSEIYTTFSKEL